jgi:Holliday junction resolvase RusA-like endonuclease
MYSPKTDWRNHCLKVLKEQDARFDKAICLRLIFYMPRPKNHYRTGKFSELLKDSAPSFHTKKPDVDNLSKAVLDAMTDAGILSDDSIVVQHYIYKKYTESETGVKIEIEELE